MTVIVGAVQLAVAAILFAWAFVQFRRPQRPAWTRIPGMDQTITVLFTGLLAFGFSFIIDGVATSPAGGLGVMEIAIALAIVGGAGWVLRRFVRGARDRHRPVAARMVAVEAGAAMSAANNAGDRTPPLASGSGGKGGKRRKAA